MRRFPNAQIEGTHGGASDAPISPLGRVWRSGGGSRQSRQDNVPVFAVIHIYHS